MSHQEAVEASREKLKVAIEDVNQTIEDDIHHHFALVRARDVFEVRDEALKILSILLAPTFDNIPVEPDSEFDHLLYGTAAAAIDTVFLALSEATGLSPSAWRRALEDWTEPGTEAPTPAIGLEAFVDRVREQHREIQAENEQRAREGKRPRE